MIFDVLIPFIAMANLIIAGFSFRNKEYASAMVSVLVAVVLSVMFAFRIT